MEFLTRAEDILDLTKVYDTWVICMAHYASGETLVALEKSQNYIKDVQRLLEDEHWERIAVQYGSIPDAIIFFFTIHCSVWAARVYRFDDKKVETNIGDVIMEEAENILIKVEDFMQSEEDHIVHLRLSYIYCKIKLLNLKMSKNQSKIDKLFKEAKSLRHKCLTTRECMHFRALIDVLYVTLSFRANRPFNAKLRASEVIELFSEDDFLKKDKGISLELAHLCIYQVEKAVLEQDDLQIRYTKDGLQFLKNVFGKKATKMKCRLYQNLATMYMNSEQCCVIKCFPIVGNTSNASKYMRKAQRGWGRLIKLSPTNLNQSKWFSHSMLRNYREFVAKSKSEHFQNMKTLFEFMFEQIFSSPEVDNLEIWEIWMRVLWNRGSFNQILEICQNSKQIVPHEKLVYPYNIIMGLLEKVSLMETSRDTFMENQRKGVAGALSELKFFSDHPKLYSWYAKSAKSYTKYLTQRDDLKNLEIFLERNSNVSFLVPFRRPPSLESLSCATTWEILDVPFSKVAFDFVLSIQLDTLVQENVVSDVEQSLKNLGNVLEQNFGVYEDNIQIYETVHCKGLARRHSEGQVLMIIQIKDDRTQMKSAEEIKQLLAASSKPLSTKFTWLIIQNILISQEEDPEYRCPQTEIKLTEDIPKIEKDCEIVVIRSLQKIYWRSFSDTAPRKYLSDSLATVLQKEIDRLFKEEKDATFEYGDAVFSVEELCAKMRKECNLNQSCYLSAKPVTELPNSKEFCFTLPTFTT